VSNWIINSLELLCALSRREILKGCGKTVLNLVCFLEFFFGDLYVDIPRLLEYGKGSVILFTGHMISNFQIKTLCERTIGVMLLPVA